MESSSLDIVVDRWDYADLPRGRVVKLKFNVPDLGLSHSAGCYIDGNEESAKHKCLVIARNWAAIKREANHGRR